MTVVAPPAGASPVEYPVRLTIAYPATQSRLTNLPLGIGMFIRAILLIPHFISLYFFQLAASITFFIATFAILFSGRYPRGLFDFYVGYTRWSTNVNAYIYSLFDAYPPYSTEAAVNYPLQLEIDYPENPSRLLNFPFFGILVKMILLIPHYVAIMFLYIGALVVLFIAHFAILFTGSFPEGMHRFVTGVLRWSTRINAYTVAITDKYPPFSTN